MGDEGCRELFKFLCKDGRHHPITEIILKSNEIGDAGLESISDYLEGNTHLKVLNLQDV